MNSRNFFAELKRRNVYKIAVAYVVVSWLLSRSRHRYFRFSVPNLVVSGRTGTQYVQYEIAVLTANNKLSLAYLPRGALGTGSGAVVFFSDSNCIEAGTGGITSANDNILILNSLALQP